MRASVAFLLFAVAALCGAPVRAEPAQSKQAAPDKKEKINFLNADNGLGAAALGQIGLTVGAMAFSGPAQWQGYQRSDDGIPFVNDSNGVPFGTDNCAAKEGNDLAKALMAQNDKPLEAAAPEGVLRLSDAERHAAASAYDGKAMYQGGSSCGQN